MTKDRNASRVRIGVVVSAATLIVAISLPLTAMADQSGNAVERVGDKGDGDRGQKGLDKARDAGAEPPANESATGNKRNKGSDRGRRESERGRDGRDRDRDRDRAEDQRERAEEEREREAEQAEEARERIEDDRAPEEDEFND